MTVSPGLRSLQRDLVADRNGLARRQPEVGIVLGDDAQHLGAGLEILDDDDADVVLAVMDQQVAERSRIGPSCDGASPDRARP